MSEVTKQTKSAIPAMIELTNKLLAMVGEKDTDNVRSFVIKWDFDRSPFLDVEVTRRVVGGKDKRIDWE